MTQMVAVKPTFPSLPLTLPVKTFIRWALLVIILFGVTGIWLANTLVEARQQGLVQEVKVRISLQASGRAAVVSEWLLGQLNLSENLVSSDLLRLFAAEMGPMLTVQQGNTPEDGTEYPTSQATSGLRTALQAQLPYMQRTLNDFVERNQLVAAQLISHNGQLILATTNIGDLSQAQVAGVNEAMVTKSPRVLPARLQDNELVLDLVKPVYELEEESRAPKVVAVFLYTIPLAEKLLALLDVGPLARDGEKSYLLQHNGLTDLMLVSTNGPVALDMSEPAFIESASHSLYPVVSPIDGTQSFAALAEIRGTPFRILHEFEATKALEFMALYRQGVYGMVSLAVLALISLSLMLVGHLLAQRNKTRVTHQSQTIQALIRAVEIRDPHLGGHHNKVARLAVNLGNDLKLPVRQRSTLFYAAQLSGVGKIFVPAAIFTKEGKLTQKEREVMEEHVNHAMNVLKDIDFELPIAEVIQQMHEKDDGSGYPQQLESEHINHLSKVLGICDAYVAMTAPRAYRAALQPQDAIAVFRQYAAKYDQNIVDALAQRVIPAA